MIYPRHFEEKIGFSQIKSLIRDKCISAMGAKYVDKIRFSSNDLTIRMLLEQVSEFKEILTSGDSFPSQDYFDLRGELARLKTPGTYIEQEALFDLKTSLQTITNIVNYFQKSNEDELLELKSLLTELDFPDDILPLAVRIIDDKGEIKNSASEKLAEVRKQLIAKERQVIKETTKAFNLAKKSKWIPEDSEVTIRNGRSVIPLKIADKRAISGIIHDESSSGQTVFIEPTESFEVNNQIRELENEERREIIRILTHFTDRLRPDLYHLHGAYRFLGLIDFIRAKALFALYIKAEQPNISNDKNIVLSDAVHPLLFLTHQSDNKEVIPLHLELTPQNRILVISGPNAGGKSVCLKTIGLLQYMLQCGLQIPCSPDSSLPVFQNLFIDIGDEQSLENDLSTYSSHLLNMKHFLSHANADTLFLIDEFGTGTEPQLGAAIAEATLEQLNQKQAFGVITTHYTNLKLVAQKTNGLLNGAMLFDSKAMQPLYQLQIGNPGSSFAFEIAKKIGFPNYVLNQARKKSGGKHISFDKQLQQMEIEKLSIEKKQKEVDATDEHLSEMVEKYTNLMEEVKKNKKHILQEAKEEALRIVESSNKAVEKTIRDIKEAKAEKFKTKEIREDLEEKKNALRSETKEKPKTRDRRREKISLKLKQEEISASNEQIKIGDFVRIKNTDIIGELMEVSGNEAILNVNEIRLKTTYKKLVKTDQRPINKINFRSKNRSRGIMNEINEKAANFSLSIDLRGKRVDEAIPMLQKYVDEAILLSISEVNILHGKGDGILRPIIREYLQTIDEIKHFGDAPLEFGGAGITKVYLK